VERRNTPRVLSPDRLNGRVRAVGHFDNSLNCGRKKGRPVAVCKGFQPPCSVDEVERQACGRAGVKTDGSCRFEPGWPPVYEGGRFCRRRTGNAEVSFTSPAKIRGHCTQAMLVVMIVEASSFPWVGSRSDRAQVTSRFARECSPNF